MKSLLVLLLEINNSDKIAICFFFILFAIFIVVLCKNIAIKKINGILNSVGEITVPKLISVYPNNPLCAIPTTEKKILFEVKCQGSIVKVLSDPGNYVEKIKKKIEQRVNIHYIKIKFLRLKVNFVLGIE